MSNKLTISILQCNTIWHEKEKNLANISKMLNNIPSGTELVVLPEMFSTGFSMRVEEFAEEMFGNTHQFMIQLAKNHNVIITGSIIIDDRSNYYNRFMWVEPSGKTHYYDKRHLFHMGLEDTKYTPGNDRVIIDYKGFRFMPQVCYDLRFPVWSRNTNDYDVLIYTANWPSPRQNVWDILLPARAIENQAYVLGANRVGTDGNNISYNGHSKIIDFKGAILAEITDTEGICTAEIDLDELNSFRKKFPAYKDSDNFLILD